MLYMNSVTHDMSEWHSFFAYSYQLAFKDDFVSNKCWMLFLRSNR